MFRRALLPIPFAAALLVMAACGSSNNNNPPAASAPDGASNPTNPTVSAQDAVATATPIKHLVVIFGENGSFDHYFATYPNAANFTGDPQFTPLAGTPAANTLAAAGLTGTTNPNALPGSPNLAKAAIVINGVSFNALTTPAAAPLTVADVTPFRLDRSQANTRSQNHSYTPEQLGDHNGAMDAFPMFTSAGNTGVPGATTGAFGSQGQVLGYFDGNTVTAYWNYAQHFAMSDNAWTDTFGPSTPGAIEVVSGQNNGMTITANLVTNNTVSTNAISDGAGDNTMIGDLDPATDDCSIAAQVVGGGNPSNPTAMMKGKNIGDLLNAKNLTWGGFMGGFDLTATNPNGTKGCLRSTFSDVLNSSPADYVQHHAWFQYYATTANPHHERPTSTALIGFTDPKDTTGTSPVHHQYDSNDFFTAVKAGNYPSVSFIKAPSISDGHPGNSDPIDEQAFDTKVINFLMQQPDWKNTAVIIAYDDSDGWYDHQKPTLTSASTDNSTLFSADGGTNNVTGADQYDSAGSCGIAAGATRPVGVAGVQVNGRCGPGTRTPFIVISPYARANYVDHTQITQASVVRFIEDNWLGSQRIGQGSFDATAGDIRSMFDFTTTGTNPTLFLDESQGTVLAAAPAN